MKRFKKVTVKGQHVRGVTYRFWITKKWHVDLVKLEPYFPTKFGPSAEQLEAMQKTLWNFLKEKENEKCQS